MFQTCRCFEVVKKCDGLNEVIDSKTHIQKMILLCFVRIKNNNKRTVKTCIYKYVRYYWTL